MLHFDIKYIYLLLLAVTTTKAAKDMAEKNDHQKDGYFSKVVRAGKRTYFFDVKSTRKGEYYLTITESKRKFNNEQGKFFYEKFKIFLYKEDFDKFTSAMDETLDFIKAHNQHLDDAEPEENTVHRDAPKQEDNDGVSVYESQKHSDVSFEDLGKKDDGTAEDKN